MHYIIIVVHLSDGIVRYVFLCINNTSQDYLTIDTACSMLVIGRFKILKYT